MMTDIWRSSLIFIFFGRTLGIVGTYIHFKSEISGTLPNLTCVYGNYFAIYLLMTFVYIVSSVRPSLV